MSSDNQFHSFLKLNIILNQDVLDTVATIFGFVVVAVKRHCFFVVLVCFFMLLSLLMQLCNINVAVNIVRITSDGLLVRLNSFLFITIVIVSRSKIEVTFSTVLVQLNGNLV